MLGMRANRSRTVPAAIAVVALLLAVPQTARAEEQGIWSQWASEVLDREYKIEIPLAILVSLPPMIIITPFWLVQKLSEGNGESGD